MLMCKNKTFNKIFFFSIVFFIISFVSYIMICHAAPPSSKKSISVLQDNTSKIQIQQRQIINQLEGMEQKYVK
jgi:hypothetical protein